MPTPVGYANCSVLISQTGDQDAYAITFGVATDLANFTPLEHANHVFAATAPIWDGAMSSSCTFERAVLRFGQDGADDIIIDSDIAPVVGQTLAPKLPQNCALLVKKNSGFGGRRNRGRCFIPMVLNESTVSNTGEIAAADMPGWQDVADDWFEALADNLGGIAPSTPMVILHTPDPISGVVLPPTMVTSLTVDNIIATQRRRLRR